ncbi:MAG: cupin domain-containing protein [Candidatus Bathyarchaeia archaeon]
MKVFHFREVKAEEAAEEGASKLRVRWLITENMGAPNFAMRLFEMEPGGHSPLHSHPWEHEVFILEGEGVVVGADGEKKLKAGYVVFVPSGERHQFRNDSDKSLKFLCLVPHHSKPK